MIRVSDDGTEIIMDVATYMEWSNRNIRVNEIEFAVILAYQCLVGLGTEEDRALALDEFDHVTRQYMAEIRQLQEGA